MFKRIRSEPVAAILVAVLLLMSIVALKPRGVTMLKSLWIGSETDTSTVTVGDNDVYIKGTLEVDGAFYADGDMTFGGLVAGISTKSLDAATPIWTLSASEQKTTILVVSSGTNGALPVIVAPQTTGKIYIVRVEGGSPQVTSVTIVGSATDPKEKSVKVLLNNTAVVYYDGTGYRRLAVDSRNSPDSE